MCIVPSGGTHRAKLLESQFTLLVDALKGKAKDEPESDECDEGVNVNRTEAHLDLLGIAAFKSH